MHRWQTAPKHDAFRPLYRTGRGIDIAIRLAMQTNRKKKTAAHGHILN